MTAAWAWVSSKGPFPHRFYFSANLFQVHLERHFFFNKVEYVSHQHCLCFESQTQHSWSVFNMVSGLLPFICTKFIEIMHVNAQMNGYSDLCGSLPSDCACFAQTDHLGSLFVCFVGPMICHYINIFNNSIGAPGTSFLRHCILTLTCPRNFTRLKL